MAPASVPAISVAPASVPAILGWHLLHHPQPLPIEIPPPVFLRSELSQESSEVLLARWLRSALEVLRFYRRRLPHWRLQTASAVYFVTWRLADGQVGLTASERDLVAAVLRHGDGGRFSLLAFVVMDDHVHVLVEPLSVTLERIVHSWKSYSAHQLQREHRRPGAVWQHESFDRVVRNEDELHEKAQYIAGNPWKRWPATQRYEWVWQRGDR